MLAQLLPIDLTSTLAAAARHIGSALVCPSARLALSRITDRIPAALTRRVYLECRLADAAPRVDVVFCVDESSRGLLMELQGAWLSADLQRHPLWVGLRALCTRWADPRSGVGNAIYDLWLEFDTADRPAEGDGLVPCVFVGLKRGAAASPLHLWDTAIDAAETVASRPVGRDIAAVGRRVLSELTRDANLPYIGLMHPRGEKAIRLCVSPLSGAALLDYLTAIEWPGAVNELEQFLRALPCGCDRTALDSVRLVHLDVLDSVQPRIGLEIPLQQYPQVVDGIVERMLLDALCDRGLCSPAKREQLLRWPGYSSEEFPHQCWPSLALRRVSHVKVVYESGRPPEVKTYLSFFHDAARRRGLEEA